MTETDPTEPVSEVTWGKPPVKIKYDWQKIAAQLRENPMEWANIFERGPTSVANAIRQGSVQAVMPSRGFEVLTTNNTRGKPRTCDLWLRYNPDKANPIVEAIMTNKKGK